jgi:hypothetical protein
MTTDEMTGTAGPGCGTGQKGLLAHRGEVPADLHFGSATIEFTTASIGLRDGTYVADDAIPAGIGLSADEIAVAVSPGRDIILRGDGLVLSSITARVVPWSSVSFEGGLGASSASPTGLGWRVRSDGALSISAPIRIGDYEVEFLPIWHSTCLEGDGTAYGRIKVQ